MSAHVPPHAVGPPYLGTEFLERLAHELRGPAGVTSGALDEIELAAAENQQHLQTYLAMARRGVRRVLRLAERLQRTAQLERGEVEWAMTPTDLRALTEQASIEAEVLEARRAVRVAVSCSPDACPVAIDPGWIRFAITELVGNAIRFARSEIHVSCTVSGDEVRVTIADDGPGFARPPGGHLELPSDRRGIAMSVPLVRDAVAAHGGRLELDGPRDSHSGALPGARVVMVLPRADGSAP